MRFGTNRISQRKRSVLRRDPRPSRAAKDRSDLAPFIRQGLGLGILFFPGLFLICVGLCALVAPHLVIAAVSALLVFTGGIFLLAAWKFIQWKKKLESVARSFEAHLVIQPGRIPDPDEQIDESPSSGRPRKVMYH